VPKQYVVRSAGRAVDAAHRVGYPVVVKPLNANHGRGASLNLEEDEQVEAAFGHASQYSRNVIV
jgi:cyanophycin synthetase